MRETKTKKFLFGLFLIPFASLVSGPFVSPHYQTSTVNAAVVACGTTSSTYTISDDGKTITRKTKGTQVVNPGTSYQSCTPVNETDTFTEKGDTLVYNGTNKGSKDNPCYNQITLDTAPISGSNDSGTYQGYNFSAGCQPDNDTETFGDLLVPTTYTGKVGTTSSDDPTKTTNCSIQGLGWVICPVMRLGAGVADAALGFISNNFLEVNVGLYSTTADGGGPSATYSAWQWILGFANIIFVIVFLVIIFSQATGFGISNYGIKKMLPKLIIGVVLINVSFFICQIMIDASNLTGYGINKFFDGIAKGIPTASGGDIASSGSPFTDLAVQILTSIAAVGVIIAAFSVFAPILAAAVIGLLMIFLFLVARQALIILAIIIAPLAFASWLLPNTEKFFKQWWKIFTQLLLLFPIVALVFGASKLVSRIIVGVYSATGATDSISSGLASANTIQGSGSSNFLGQVIAAAVLVVPLFAVPFILKGALNAVPVLGNLATRHHGRATSGAKKRVAESDFVKYRQGRRADRAARVKSGNYAGPGGKLNPYNVASKLNRGLNKSRTFNAATLGYGGYRNQAAERQGEKDTKEFIDGFNQNEGLMKAWALDKGGHGAEYGKLDEASKLKYDQMRATGMHRKANSFMAVASYMSENGKGDFSHFQSAMRAAKDAGASESELEETLQASTAKYRSSGRGDIVGMIRANEKANEIPGSKGPDGKPISRGLYGTASATADENMTEMVKAWGDVGKGRVHRDGVKENSAGAEAFQRYIRSTSSHVMPDGTVTEGNAQNLSASIEKFNELEQRSQNLVEQDYIRAAEEHRAAEYKRATDAGQVVDPKYEGTITSINQAKQMFGLLPGNPRVATPTGPAPTGGGTVGGGTARPAPAPRLNFGGMSGTGPGAARMVMDAGNVSRQINDLGGWSNLSNDEVYAAYNHANTTLSYDNSDETNGLGSAANDELQRRGILPGPLNPQTPPRRP